jgi:hypothetical protein
MSRGRPSSVIRPTRLSTFIPEDLRAKLDLHLFSDVEGRIPVGAYSQFLADRVREFFEVPKETLITMNVFASAPPKGYATWEDWFTAPVKSGVYIRALEANEWNQTNASNPSDS